MGFVVILIGGFLGRWLIGALLNGIFIPGELDNPNPNTENIYGWIGTIIGAIIAGIIYNL